MRRALHTATIPARVARGRSLAELDDLAATAIRRRGRAGPLRLLRRRELSSGSIAVVFVEAVPWQN